MSQGKPRGGIKTNKTCFVVFTEAKIESFCLLKHTRLMSDVQFHFVVPTRNTVNMVCHILEEM